jgi:hypothetical protein
MRWNHPWDTGKSTNALFNRASTIDITASAKVMAVDGSILQHILFSSFDADDPPSFWPMISDVEWNKVESIHIAVDIEYDINLVGNEASGSGRYNIDQMWRVVYGDNGISFESPQAKESGGQPTGDFAVAVLVQPDQNIHETAPLYVALQIRLTGGYQKDGATVGFTVGSGVQGSIGKSFGKSSSSYLQDFEAKIWLHVRGKPDAPPKPADPIVIPPDLLSFDVYFDEQMGAGKPQGEEAPYLSATQLSRLEDSWVKPMQRNAPELYAAIRHGKCTLGVSGYASDTGREAYDKELSAQRAESLENAIMTQFKSVNIVFERQAYGHDRVWTKGAAPQEKRVEISIDAEQARLAIESSRQKK